MTLYYYLLKKEKLLIIYKLDEVEQSSVTAGGRPHDPHDTHDPDRYVPAMITFSVFYYCLIARSCFTIHLIAGLCVDLLLG